MTTREKAEWLSKNPMYQHDCSAQQAMFADDVVEQFLADHPADEDVEVTEEWLRSMGFGEAETKYCDVWLGKRINDRYIIDVCSDWTAGIVCEDDYGCIPGKYDTRGKMRLLCRALGIPTPTQQEESGK